MFHVMLYSLGIASLCPSFFHASPPGVHITTKVVFPWEAMEADAGLLCSAHELGTNARTEGLHHLPQKISHRAMH